MEWYQEDGQRISGDGVLKVEVAKTRILDVMNIEHSKAKLKRRGVSVSFSVDEKAEGELMRRR